MKKILINTFALIGFVTFILLACSVDDIDSSDNNNSNQIVSNTGKYQMIAEENTDNIYVLNTESGVLKRYDVDQGDGYTELPWATYTFTH